MEFEQLKAIAKEGGFETLRVENENYLEAVLLKNKLEELMLKLDSFFGPAQNKPSAQAQEAVGEFGGITKGQTLYFCQEGESFVFAMLWPWQDGEHITLKLAYGA